MSWIKIDLKGTSFIAITVVGSMVISLVIGELLVRYVRPQESLYPRWKVSRAYVNELYPNARMVHTVPGRWKFIYTINQYGYRGRPIIVSNKYDKQNIVVLGDSCSFGNGVNDGEEWPMVMQDKLDNNFNVINLSVGGYGLTQEIRRYYEFGQLYHPKYVILQFCANDPHDNFIKRVTDVKNGRFIFYGIVRSFEPIKICLSKSYLQKSQLFNLVFNYFVRPRPSRKMTVQELKKVDKLEDINRDDSGIAMYGKTFDYPSKEEFYNVLLVNFAEDLKRRGVILLMIDVDNQLSQFPLIKNKVEELEKGKLINYVPIVPWLKNVKNDRSPEGHPWGVKSHSIIGSGLAHYISKGHQ